MINQVINIESEAVLDTFIIGLEIFDKTASVTRNVKDTSKEGKNAKDISDSKNKDEAFYVHLRAYQAAIGIMGEEFILAREKEKLQHTDYHNKIRHVSKTNDSAGYDILSYEVDGTELYIEVKTTDKNHNFFYLTHNELTTALELQKLGKKYLIYRVENIMTEPSYSVIVHSAPSGGH